MRQILKISGSTFHNKNVVLMIIFFLMIMFLLGYASSNANNSTLNGMNGVNAKSDLMFYNDNNESSGKAPEPFSAAVGHKLADGIEVTAAGSQYPVKIIPITLPQATGIRGGNRITYSVARGVHIIYTFKRNGVKEDIVFDHPSAIPMDLAFRLELDPMLEARLDRKGNILIYGPNAILSSFIQTGDEKSAELILKARRRAPKDNLLYIIPAPVVIDGSGIKHKSIAHYTLDKSILTLHAEGLSSLPSPVSIDPSIVVTTTADFLTGNNEGMISFDVDAISRAVPSGGSIGNWTATTSFTPTCYSFASVAYNGYLYVIGGRNASSGYLNDVQFAPLNANGTIGSWTTTTSFNTGRYGHTSVAYNGYLYVIGGWGTIVHDDVQFAPINANGTVGTWTITTSFSTPRWWHTSVAYNGYLYVIGGNDGFSYFNDVQFAPINANGTIGSWTTTTSFNTGRLGHTSVAYNGYLYVIAGTNHFIFYNDVQLAPINADGTIGAWASTISLTTARAGQTSVAYNGCLYVIGGLTNGGVTLNDVLYATINSNGRIGTWNTSSSFATARYLHTSIAYNNYLYVIGGTISEPSSLGDVQFAPINPMGAISAWTATTSFVTARELHTSAAYNGYLYVLGGVNGPTRYNDVQYAHINADGTVGTWYTTTSFNTPRYGHTSVAYNGYLYVLGGTSGVNLNDVQYAPINADGSVGSWATTTSFITARLFHATVAYNGYLYVIGGYAGAPYFNDVQFAPIYTNGTVGSWTTTTSFSVTRRSHTSVAYGGYLYVLGGTYGTTYLNDVQLAPINANGTVGSWTTTTSFTTGRSSHISEAYNGFLYVLGGYNGSSSYLSDVQVAPINADGTIGSWSNTTSFPFPVSAHTSALYNGYLYVLGGATSPGAELNDVQFAFISSNGTIGSWTATTSFPTARRNHTSVAYNGYLYVIGGYDGSQYLNDVQFAPINANGTIGAWTATTSFQMMRMGHTSIVYNGYLYVLGGYYLGSYYNNVQFAPINTNGTVGTWTYTISFATARAYHTSVVYSGYLYVLGGTNGSSYYNDVQYAPVNANGTIGAWNATASFATVRYSFASAAYNGYLYVLGGNNASSSLNDVQFAPVNADGTIGSWNTTTTFTAARYGHTSVVYNGFIYVLGGYAGGSYRSDVQFAPINSNGTLGTWNATTSLITARQWHTSVAYNGFIYVLGGYGGAYLSDVRYATLNGAAARARYSKLLDIGSDQIVESIQFSNSGGKGITNLTYTVAPSSTAVFGSRTTIPGALSGLPYTTGLNSCSRYIWTHFDLDDTLSVTLDNDGLNGRNNLLDFTITYDVLAGIGTSFHINKSSPNVHLSWSSSPNATSYNVLRCDSATTPCTPVTIASPTTNSYDDPVLASTTNYWYYIQAVNGSCVEGVAPSHSPLL